MKADSFPHFLRESDAVPGEVLDRLVESAGREKRPLEDLLLSENVLTEEALSALLARFAGREFCDLLSIEPVRDLLRRTSPEGMRKWRFVPIREEGGRLVVASPDWRNPLQRDEVERHVARPARVIACARTAFDRVIDRWADSARTLRPQSVSLGVAQEKRDTQEEARVREALEDASPYVRILNGLLIDAVQKGASDIHLEAETDRSIVRFRIDGVLLRGADPIDIAFHPRIVSRIKVISDLDISETRKAQDGSFQFTALGRTIDFRVSIIPSIHGEDVVIRILDKEHLRTEFSQMNLSRLGFGDGVVEGIRRLTRFPHGMFLVTGPTGSGKTTTLYTTLQEMDHDVRKFITIEDPVEYHLPGIVQIPVNEMKGVTFASGLRNILRHDPDVVMVGEIRDKDTAEVAVQASLTGHLVFSTVHANSSTDVILRFLHMGIDPYNFVSAVNGVLTQRLLRTLCARCRKEARYGPSALAELGIPAAPGDAGGLFFEPVGCAECNGTGYKGRISTGEFVPFTEEIRDWMIQRRSFGEIRAGIRKSGIASLRGNAVALARSGRTSVAEINRVTSPEED
ncbi:MAG: type secretion system ATPase PulE [Deltaproteobacteria bacterium]|nr:type secretion system ATPase PulE [Deltaproteobacteria bacterium]